MVGASSVLLASFLTLLSPVLGAWTDDWAAIRAAAANVRSLQADFTQTKRLKILKRPIVAHGKFYYRRPGQIRWEYTSPVKSVVLLDGSGLRRYTWRGNRWVRDAGANLGPVQAVLREMDLWMRGDFSSSKVFTPRLSPGSPARIHLSPRDAALKKYVSGIDLILSTTPGVVDGIDISEGPGASTRIDMERVKLNQRIPDKVFESVQ
jgi:outer membrane lipoprotein-sorting protein